MITRTRAYELESDILRSTGTMLFFLRIPARCCVPEVIPAAHPRERWNLRSTEAIEHDAEGRISNEVHQMLLCSYAHIRLRMMLLCSWFCAQSIS